MFRGKSERLIRRLRRVEIARQQVQIFKPAIDTHPAGDHIVSHRRIRIGSRRVARSQEFFALMTRQPGTGATDGDGWALAEGGVLGAFILLILMTPSDPDLWGHLRFGLDTLSSGHVAVPDAYSFTSDRPWINHEWLAEYLTAVSYRWLGIAGLQLLKLAVAFIAYAIAMRSVGRHARGWRRLLLMLLVFVTGIYPLTHTIRPQMFSILGFTTLLVVLNEIHHGSWKAAFTLPVLFCFWANTHGGWLVGAGVYAVWTTFEVLRREPVPHHRVRLVVVAVASAGATLVTPYGFALWQFLAETVRLARPDIEEWLPITDNTILILPWLLTAALAIVSVARRRPRPWQEISLVTMLAFASFRVSRIGPFFSLAVAILLLGQAPGPDGSPLPGPSRQTRLAMAFVCLLIVGLAIARRPATVTCLETSADLAIDNQAAAFIADHDLRGRLVVWFNWGEYALWHFGPQLKVSMDGRRETVYSERTMDAHSGLYKAAGNARAFLAGLHADYIWLPPTLPLNRHLGEWGWQRVFTSDRSVIWAVRPLPPAVRAGAIPTRCFPGA
jgi:hypothetical protein